MDKQILNYNNLLNPNTFVFNNYNLIDGITDNDQIKLLTSLNTCNVTSEELLSSINNIKTIFSKCNKSNDQFKCSYDLLSKPEIKTMIKNIINLYTKINFECTIATQNAISNDRKVNICSTNNNINITKLKQTKEILTLYIDVIIENRNNIRDNIKKFNNFCNNKDSEDILIYLDEIDRLLGNNLNASSPNQLDVQSEELNNLNTKNQNLNADNESLKSTNTLLIILIIIVIIIFFIVVIIIIVQNKSRKNKMFNSYNQNNPYNQ